MKPHGCTSERRVKGVRGRDRSWPGESRTPPKRGIVGGESESGWSDRGRRARGPRERTTPSESPPRTWRPVVLTTGALTVDRPGILDDALQRALPGGRPHP